MLLHPQSDPFTNCRYSLIWVPPVLNSTFHNATNRRTRRIVLVGRTQFTRFKHFFPPFPFSLWWPLTSLPVLYCSAYAYMVFVDHCDVEFLFSCLDYASILYVSTCILFLSSCETSSQINSRIILSYHGRRCILLPLSFSLVLLTVFLFSPKVSKRLYCIIAVL